MKARIFPIGIGRTWRTNRRLVAGAWAIDPRRACVLCSKSYRECACADARPCPLDGAVS